MLHRNLFLGALFVLCIAGNLSCWLAVAVIGIRARHGDYGLADLGILRTFQSMVQATAIFAAAFDVLVSSLIGLAFMRLRQCADTS